MTGIRSLGTKEAFIRRQQQRLFPMLVATGSFSLERGLPVKFDVDLNHFKSIVMSV